MDDDAIRALLTRLARPDASGGVVIERAAILAAGSYFTAVMEWVTAHGGKAETVVAAGPGGGLHGSRVTGRGGEDATPLRFVLPPGALARPAEPAR
jgi:hypothetical protein